MLDTPQDAGRRHGTDERSQDVSDRAETLDAWYTDVYGGDVQFAKDFGMVDTDESGAEIVDLDSDVGEIFDTILIQQASSDSTALQVQAVGTAMDNHLPALPMLFPVRWHSLSLENKFKFHTMMEWFHAARSPDGVEFVVESDDDDALVIDVQTSMPEPEVQSDGSVVVELSVRPLGKGEAEMGARGDISFGS